MKNNDMENTEGSIIGANVGHVNFLCVYNNPEEDMENKNKRLKHGPNLGFGIYLFVILQMKSLLSKIVWLFNSREEKRIYIYIEILNKKFH